MGGERLEAAVHVHAQDMKDRVLLPAALSVTTLSAFGQRLTLGLDGFLGLAGLDHKNTRSGKVRIRAAHPRSPLVEAIPLQDSDGALIATADELLRAEHFDNSLSTVVQRALDKTKTRFESLSFWQQVQLSWMAADDPMIEAQKVVDALPHVRLWRIRATARLQTRLAFWRMCDQLLDGVDVDDVKPSRGLVDQGLISGLVEVAPASLVAMPLTARLQPLAAVLLSSAGAQVAITTTAGAFLRPMHLDEWPVGFGHPSLGSDSTAAYRSSVTTVPSEISAQLLGASVSGADELLETLTDPANWADDSGVVAHDERWLAWASVHWGIAAINAIGGSWGARENIWSAFRALTILADLWNCKLEQLLDPRNAQAAADALPAPLNQRLADVVQTYEVELGRAFSPNLEEAARQVADLRHLVHGVAVKGKERYRRLEALRKTSQERPALQLVVEIAVAWWSALLLAPGRFFSVSSPPWART
jgi:hypothetical protein